MNVEKILHYADVVEQQPWADRNARAGFNMAVVLHPCGTPSCIAGWVEFGENGKTTPSRTMAQTGRASLDLSSDQWFALFYGRASRPGLHGVQAPGLHQVQPKHAAAVMRHLANTGDVDWAIGAEHSPGVTVTKWEE